MFNRRKYLVTGARAPATLEVIRRLGRAGHVVLAADSVRFPPGRFSRYASRYFRVPEPRRNSSGFIVALRQILSDEKVDVLLPTCEEIYYVSRHRVALEVICEVFCPHFDMLDTLHHKGRFAELTQRAGQSIAAPESVVVESAAQLASFASDSHEWVFKPVYSRFGTKTVICPNSAQFASMMFTKSNPWLAQRCIAGRELSSYSIAVRGQLTAQIVYHSRYRAGPAAGICFASESHPRVRAFVEQLAAHLDFSGQLAFDFIECAETNRVFVLECNPRLTSGVHLLPSGFDLDGAFRGDSTPLDPPPEDDRPKMLGAAMLSIGFAKAMHTGLLSAWYRDFVNADDVVLARDDRIPALGQLLFLAEMGNRSIRRRTGLVAATTHDIEWNG